MALLGTPTYAVTPAPTLAPTSANYLASDAFDFSIVELPDTYKQNFEIYGNRSIASFLRASAAELPHSSDLIKWSEEGRLHVLHSAVERSTNTFEFGNGTPNVHALRARQTVIVSDGSQIQRGIVESITDANTAVIVSLEAAGWGTLGTSALKLYVYGSEFKKGTEGMVGSLEAELSFKDTSAIIIKEAYKVAGTDMTQIGWVEVSTEIGGSGYYWYLKSEHETRMRYDDYLEMSMVEGRPKASGSTADARGVKGLFYEIENGGNVFQSVISAKEDVDAVLKRLDKQGAIEENMLYVERDQDLAIDDFLAQQNSYGVGGTSYGAFNNSEEMALNLGFKGFCRGGYEFYKTSWKYLNDATTRGALDGTGKIRGIMCPVGTKTVYDQVLGQNIRLPFLHVKYRKSPTEDRKYRTWAVGGAGAARTSSLDAMEIHFLSERALVVIGANNYVLIQD